MSTDILAVSTNRAGRAAWLALLFTVALVIILYLALSLSVSSHPLLMPLDDTYIHFQYARQWAHGEPMVYNPGDPATSGGTSLIYPPLLALGYLLGFTGWSLGYWAIGIGVLCFWGSTWLIYQISAENPLLDQTDHSYAFWIALAFALSGPFIWAALSGMETALFVFSVLLVFYAFQRNQFRLMVGVSVLMTLIRPEGLILAGFAMLAWFIRLSGWKARFRSGGWLALPVVAGFVQPLINWLATGSTTSSGMQAKSHLYNTGAPFADRIGKIWEFFGRMWSELLQGRSPDFGAYTSPLLAEVALASLLVGCWLAWRKRKLNPSVLALAWILVLSAAVATLDTAFWQFKRYQLPIMALFFPAAAWGCGALGRVFESHTRLRWARWALPALILIPSIFTTVTFARNYRDNVSVVHDQQVPMARWVSDNLPEDARIGVHDVGLMRYFGDRALYDVVGLTTPGPAEAWRQGPGAIYETMAHSEYRPDYFAIYPDVQGLRYLVNAGVFGDVLQEFPVDLPPHNVAAATNYQAVYRADWSNTYDQEQLQQAITLDTVTGMQLVDQLDVANLDSESDHDYEWWFDGTTPGFVSEVYRHSTLACDLDNCFATDGGRVLTGGEEFTLNTIPGEDLLLVTRVHGRTSAPLSVRVHGKQIAQRVQPEVPGQWVEVITLIPSDQITSRHTDIRIEADGVYMPYYHWAYQGEFEPDIPDNVEPIATFGESVRLLDYEITRQTDRFTVDLQWLGDAPDSGDGVVFVHLYGDIHREPVAQVVSRPAGGVLPPANWLAGTLQDSYTVMIPADLPPGTYSIAIGMFESATGGRYPVVGEGADADGRLFIGEITIEEP